MKPCENEAGSAGERPRFQFSIGRMLYVSSVLCVFLAEYYELGVNVWPAWFATSIAVAFIHQLWTKNWEAAKVIVYAVVGMLLLMCMMPLGGSTRGRGWDPFDWPARRAFCQGNLRSLGQCVMIYQERSKAPLSNVLDSNGAPLLSWRVQFGTIGCGPDVPHLKRSWDDPENLESARQPGMAALWQCPTDRDLSKQHTSYLALLGEDTLWTMSGSRRSGDSPDGDANTILMAEVFDSGVLWSEPRDLDATRPDWTSKVTGRHGTTVEYFDGSRRLTSERFSANLLMADGAVRSVASDIDPQVLKQFANRSDGKPAESEY